MVARAPGFKRWKSCAGHGQALEQDRTGLHVRAAVDIAADGEDAGKHVAQLGGNGVLLDGMDD